MRFERTKSSVKRGGSGDVNQYPDGYSFYHDLIIITYFEKKKNNRK